MLKDDIKVLSGVEDDDYLDLMIPILLDYADEKCKREFDRDDLPGGVKLFVANAVEYNRQPKGLSARSMGSVSYTYDTTYPDSVVEPLRPYMRMRVIDVK